MASSTKAAENGNPAGALDIWWTVSMVKVDAAQFRRKTPNAQRRTPNVEFSSRVAWQVCISSLDVGRWALDVF